MVMTVLTADVEKDKWGKLKSVYSEKTKSLPAEIVETFLNQDKKQPGKWQIVTIWRSEEDLQAMRSSGETPTGVVIFNEVGALPELDIYDIIVKSYQ